MKRVLVLLAVLAACLGSAISTAGAEELAACSPTGAESVATDKPDYPPEAIVHITGAGYAASCQVTVRVTRPDGSVVTGDGSSAPGSDAVTTSSAGRLAYDYILFDGVEATYIVDALGAGGQTLATTTFTDGPIRAQAIEPTGATGVVFSLQYTLYGANNNCSSVGTFTGGRSVFATQSVAVTTLPTRQSARLRADATSRQGVPFSHWVSSSPFSNLGGTSICVPGPNGADTYFAVYGFPAPPPPPPPPPPPSDTTAPTGTVAINGGASATSSTAATLTLTCTDNVGCAQMQVAVDGVADAEPFEAFATTKGVTLPSGDGTKTAAVKFRDAAGNVSAQATDTIVLDTTPPVLTLPANITAEATGPAGAVVTFAATADDVVDGARAVACTPASGSTFALGAAQTVTCSSSDTLGNTSTGDFTVTVADTTRPVVSPPANATAEATSPAGAVVTYADATATDAVGVATGPSCVPASGSTFSIGTTPVTCTAADAASNTGTATFAVKVEDTTAPSAVVINPTSDSLIASSPVAVQVLAADVVGVTALTVNGAAAALLPGGTVQAGTWQASVLVTLPVPVGGALVFTATAGDLAGNLRSATSVVDNDGIDAAVDTQPLASSNDFSDVSGGGTTSGTIAARGGWTVRVGDLGPGGVQAVLSGAGTSARLATCPAGGAEQVELDGAGETASVECVTTTGVNTGSKVTAINATSPAGNPRIVVRDAAGRVQARLSTGQSMTVGSPVTAGPTNVGSLPVELFDEDGAVFASFSLDAAESVDVTFATAANNVQVVQLYVLVGPVDFAIGTRTVTLAGGQSGTFPTDVAAPTIGGAAVSPTVLWPANHKMVDAAASYQVTDNRDPAPSCGLSVASSESIDGTGDGDTSPDWLVVDSHRLQLRAERSGAGTGRVYTLTVACADASGNVATKQLAVMVPKSQAAGSPGAGKPAAAAGPSGDAAYVRLCAETLLYLGNSGRGRSMCSALRAAALAESRGDRVVRDRLLDGYERRISARVGKSLTAERATILLRLVGALR